MKAKLFTTSNKSFNKLKKSWFYWFYKTAYQPKDIGDTEILLRVYTDGNMIELSFFPNKYIDLEIIENLTKKINKGD